MRIYRVLCLVTVLSFILTAGTASAQNFSTDARKVAMGGNGGDSANIASGMVDKGAPYTAIVIPLGLIQIFRDGLDRFDPSNAAFDPVRAVEDISNPLHYTFGRGTTSTGQASSSSPGQRFVTDVRNGRLNTNLLTYTGFKIPTTMKAEGLASPSFGGTIKLFKSANSFQGVYVGVGPYLGFDTEVGVDQRLADLLGSGTKTPNCATSAPCYVTNKSRIQLAMAATIGYRGKVSLGGASKRDGVYVAYNHHILKGFRYLNFSDEGGGLSVRIDTDTSGQYVFPPLVTPPAPQITPVVISGLQATSGKGHASDIGFEVVRGYFEVGFGLNGIGNQMEWTDFERRSFTLGALITPVGGVNVGFVDTTVKIPNRTETFKLPVVKTGNLGFHAFGWGAVASLAEGYNGRSFNGGVERSVGPLWLRGGGRYSRGKWDPTYGFGIGSKVALDFGFYGTHANLEGTRQTAMAVSVRFNHGSKKPKTK